MPIFHDLSDTKDINALGEDDRISLLKHLAWKQIMDKTNPDHSKHYCRHGGYLFSGCKYCTLEEQL